MSKEIKENFLNDKMQLSSYNFDIKVTNQLNLASKITLCDATLREGAQGSIIGFTTQEKLEMIKKSAEAGVKFFQIGTSQDAEEMKEIIKGIKDANLDVETEILLATQDIVWNKPLDDALAIGATFIDVLTLLTPYGGMMHQGLSTDALIENLGKQITYLVAHGGRVSFDPMDGPRTDFDTLMKAYRTAVAAGAERIRILDSVGVASMATLRYLVTSIKNEFKDVKICVHCHNDYGQAMANVYTSIECGVDIVDVCINGMGERAGNPALAEVAAGAAMLYGIDTGIKLDKMYELSSFVGDIAKHTPDRNKPIVGDWAFAHGDEGHHMICHFSPWAFEGIKAEVFGNEQKILLGPKGGLFSTKSKLTSLGFKDVEDDVAMEIFHEVVNNTKVRKTILRDEDIKIIAKKYISK